MNNKNSCVCFSGYRPAKFNFLLHESSDEYARLMGYIIFSVENGYDTFLCSMARGFDILCAETVLRLRRVSEEHKHIKLIAVMPYEEHGQTWKQDWRLRHVFIEANADDIIYLNQDYHPAVSFSETVLWLTISNGWSVFGMANLAAQKILYIMRKSKACELSI